MFCFGSLSSDRDGFTAGDHEVSVSLRVSPWPLLLHLHTSSWGDLIHPHGFGFCSSLLRLCLPPPALLSDMSDMASVQFTPHRGHPSSMGHFSSPAASLPFHVLGSNECHNCGLTRPSIDQGVILLPLSHVWNIHEFCRFCLFSPLFLSAIPIVTGRI